MSTALFLWEGGFVKRWCLVLKKLFLMLQGCKTLFITGTMHKVIDVVPFTGFVSSCVKDRTNNDIKIMFEIYLCTFQKVLFCYSG